MNIREIVLSEEVALITLRRQLHHMPEISGKEALTQQLVIQTLKDLSIPYQIVGEYGVLGILEGQSPGKTIFLRTELDGLPIQENPNNLRQKKSCISMVNGVSHLCGHDAHLAMLLTAAKILAEHSDQISGRVLFGFESGEENGSGIWDMIHALEPYAIDGVWGIHTLASLPTGRISVNEGVRMSGPAGFRIHIRGNGGHGSRPDEAVDPIQCAVQIYNHLMTIRNQLIDPTELFVLSICEFHAGSAPNIIPEEAILSGTLRFFSYDVERKAREAIYHVTKTVSEANYCSAEVHYDGPGAPVINDLNLSKMAYRAIKRAIGREALIDAPPWLASETMSRYTSKYPGVFAFLGIQNEDLGSGAAHHNECFDIDEGALKVGVAATIAFTMELLS